MCSHDHEHTHADGVTHTHPHTHDHDHCHEHTHDHDHGHEHTHAQHSPEEALAHSMEDEPAQLIHDAILDFNLGNEKLDEALKLLKGE